ncbi:MAG: Uma2 family endonuclease [Ktedonobacteraceae bacterium]|nr:Uma2 family endonuclease [Ktedonobacteraceae bacterium]
MATHRQHDDEGSLHGIPMIVVEVLSPSTQQYDCTEKFDRYKLCSTLEVYILVSQDTPVVGVYRRAAGWQREYFSGEETIMLDQLDLELPLAAIYEGVLS